MEDVAFHMGLRLERDAQAPDRSDNVAAHNYILGGNTTRHLRLVAEQNRAATDVALNLAVDLDLACRDDVASDRQVLADNRRDHLARTWAGALGSIGCRPLGEGRLRIASPPNLVIFSPASGFVVNILVPSIAKLRCSARTGARYATYATLSH